MLKISQKNKRTETHINSLTQSSSHKIGTFLTHLNLDIKISAGFHVWQKFDCYSTHFHNWIWLQLLVEKFRNSPEYHHNHNSRLIIIWRAIITLAEYMYANMTISVGFLIARVALVRLGLFVANLGHLPVND